MDQLYCQQLSIQVTAVIQQVNFQGWVKDVIMKGRFYSNIHYAMIPCSVMVGPNCIDTFSRQHIVFARLYIGRWESDLTASFFPVHYSSSNRIRAP
ncbi:hypothetical protein D3C74_445300 [compost metagenome]